MTETTITAEEALKSRANFENLVLNSPTPQDVCNFLNQYPKKGVEKIADLTQNFETLLNKIGDEKFNVAQTPYLLWFITNPKEKIMQALEVINKGDTALKIFVFRPCILDENEIGFQCLLKPQLVIKQKREVNTNTPSKQLQKTYWELYIEVCDASEYPDMQIKDALPRHYQNISIQKAGVQILQTINTQNNYVASEIAISNDKEIFEKLLDHKEDIEKEVGKLEWYSKENVKSSKIRKTYNIDINNPENHKKAILEHIKMGAELEALVHKYL